MKIKKLLSVCGFATVLTVGFASFVQAQAGAGFMTPPPAVELPAKKFNTAEEHFEYLREQADGGTQHTRSSVPDWGGLWSNGLNTTAELFFEEADFFLTLGPGGTVREGILTPAYEQQFKERRAEILQNGEQRYDRLTNCEYAGLPRWLWEPYVKEFINTPSQTWMINDLMNEIRRIYIDAEHINIEARHTAVGDSIGFWDGDKLIIFTKWVNPADFARNMPLSSNQLSLVETWQAVTNEDGTQSMVTQVTFYDPLALIEPQSAVYMHYPATDIEEVGVRIRNWECATSSNSYKDENGDTMFYLPGDPEYKDARGFTDFPELPGQSLNPIFDGE